MQYYPGRPTVVCYRVCNVKMKEEKNNPYILYCRKKISPFEMWFRWGFGQLRYRPFWVLVSDLNQNSGFRLHGFFPHSFLVPEQKLEGSAIKFSADQGKFCHTSQVNLFLQTKLLFTVCHGRPCMYYLAVYLVSTGAKNKKLARTNTIG